LYSSLVIIIALALGASKVIAIGRTQSKLDHLISKINCPRLSTYKYTGDVQADVSILSSKYPDISVAVDLLPSGIIDISSMLAALLSILYASGVSLCKLPWNYVISVSVA
jgi:threonine dehydrogenase-like Zn-dependent dehydrogenase